MNAPKGMTTLTRTALTSGGQAYDIDFLLHSKTHSSDAVATNSEAVATHPGLSDRDILQTQAMTLAIRARTAGASPVRTKQLGRIF